MSQTPIPPFPAIPAIALSGDPTPALPLPLCIGGITAEWLTRAIGTTVPGLIVRAARVLEVMPGTSTKIRVAIDYADPVHDRTLPRRVIVKGGFEDHSPALAAMFLNEIRFYRDIQPIAALRTPMALFAARDPSSHQAIVVMEDLSARGVTFCTPLQPQGFAMCARRLGDLARFHAQSWNAPDFAPGGRWDWVRSRFTTDSAAYAARYLRPEVWNHYMTLPRAAAVSSRLHDRAWMAHALHRLGEIDAQGDRCILHGDTHLGNLYVEADGTPGYLDMQVTRANWALEVAYHIATSIDLADRRRWEGALLEGYLLALRSAGVAPPELDTAWRAYVRALAYAYFIFVINEVRFQTEAVNSANTARVGAAMIDLGTMEALS